MYSQVSTPEVDIVSPILCKRFYLVLCTIFSLLFLVIADFFSAPILVAEAMLF